MKSKFDWHKEPLQLSTTITDNYKNTQNVRRFFVTQIGSHFKFNREFILWIKKQQGKSLAFAIAEWKKQYEKQ
ncbi:MAG: DUF6434 domain-containing protein [Bacteroidota bacterium]